MHSWSQLRAYEHETALALYDTAEECELLDLFLLLPDLTSYRARMHVPTWPSASLQVGKSFLQACDSPPLVTR